MSDEAPPSHRSDSVTAQDYIESQVSLENEARRIMPYDPNECTYGKGEVRQPVFACLTCSRHNNNTPIGVCYSCSIQCHSTHEIVELFSKRRYVCDCGTTRMGNTTNGACSLRQRGNGETPPMPHMRAGSINVLRSLPEAGPAISAKPEDIPSSSNEYNHNFSGLFCCCKKPYNPLEETGNMIQCYFGFSCGEDWFHEECILGYKRGIFKKIKGSGNLLDKLPPAGTDATDRSAIVQQVLEESNEEVDAVPNFPDLDDFDSFICWKCVQDFADIFAELQKKPEIVFSSLPHFDNIESVDEWTKLNEKLKTQTESDEPKVKRIKTEGNGTPYSIFLANDFREELKALRKKVPDTSKMGEFLSNHEYLYEDDPIFEPPADDDDTSTGSLLELGADALSSLPREQAIEGLEAYDKIRSKLKDFFKPFAEQGKIVTEKEVRDFFGSIEKK